MSKKVIGTVLGVAALAIPIVGPIIGMSALAMGVASVGIALASNVLLGPAKPKALATGPRDRLFATLDVTTPRKIDFGDGAAATDVRYQTYTGSNQEYLEQIICVAGHKVSSIYEIWFDNEKAWDSTAGVASKFSGYLTVATRAEGTSANGIAIDSTWTSTATLTGSAYVHLKYKLTGNDKKAESPFASGVTNRVTIRTKGAFTYDPRLDSTVTGGSGSHRADDQTTWAWSDTGSRNPALQLLWFLLGWKINGKLAVGMGIPADRIDLVSFITAANACDETVTKSAANGGGTEPRYRTDGVLSEGDNRGAVIEALCASMNAVVRDSGGKLALTVLQNDLASPVASFNEDDVLGEMQWDQTPDLSDTFNIVRGRRIDPSDNALYQPVDFPEASLSSPDGIDRIDTVEYPLVQSNGQAQRLAKQRLQRNQYQGRLTLVGGPTWWQVNVGEVIELTHAAFGWADKLFRVAGQQIRRNGETETVMVEENAAIYAWDNDEAAAVTPGTPTVYNPLNDPIVGAALDVEDKTQNLTALGRAGSGFIGTDAYPFSKIAEAGSAANGVSVSFGTTLGTVPRIIFLPGGAGPTAGSEVQVRADGLTTSGFTMKAVEVSITPGSTITDTTGTTGSGSDPDRMINRSDSNAPWDGKFKYTYAVTVPEVGPGEPGLITIGIYAKKSSVWTKVGEVSHNSSGSKVATVTPGTVDYDATAGVYEFGVNVESATAGATLDAFNSVEYTLGTPTETSLTDLTEIPWIAVMDQ